MVTSYILCATPRSGGDRVGHALHHAGIAGRPNQHFLPWSLAATDPGRLDEEWVRPWRISPRAYIKRVLQEGTTTTRTGDLTVTGVTIIGNQLEIVIRKLQSLPGFRALDARARLDRVFSNLRYIQITRRDKVAQAVDWARAVQTGDWSDQEPVAQSSMPAASLDARLAYSFDAIAYFYRHILEEERVWQAFFEEAGIRPYPVVYEDFTARPEETTRQILRHLGIPHADEVVLGSLARMSEPDAVSIEWRRRFVEQMPMPSAAGPTERTAASNDARVGAARDRVTSYFICSTPRSGSGLLAGALWDTGVLGRPDEYFLTWYHAVHEPHRLREERAAPWLVPPRAYLKRVVAEASTSSRITGVVTGVKIMGDQLDILMKKLRGRRGCRQVDASVLLERVFPNLHCIHITRRDKIAQAVSWARAWQSGEWFNFRNPIQPPTATAPHGQPDRRRTPQGVAYCFDTIADLHQQILEQERAWEAFFESSGILPYRVVYEEFVDSREETIGRILEELAIPGIRDVIFKPLTRRLQRDPINAEWTRRYVEDLAQAP